MSFKSKFPKEILLNIYERYVKGETIINIAKEYSVVPDTIYKQFKNHNIKMLSSTITQRKYKIDNDYFNEIDTEEKAYILGLLYADGTYSKSNNTISLSLQEKDVSILNKINKLFQPDKPLYFIKKKQESHQNQYRLIISSKPICEKLLLMGLMSDKSFKIRFPNIKECLINHFIRGFFDGDGCISIFLIKNKYKSCSFSITSNKIFLEHIQKIFMSILNLSKTKLSKDNRGNNINSLVYGGKQNCLKIRDYLYKDATIFLIRKHDKFYSI